MGKNNSSDMEVCPVCGVNHNFCKSETGFGLCEEHSKKWNEGYVALIIIDEEKSHFRKRSQVDKDTGIESEKTSDIIRTGEVFHMRKEDFKKLVDPGYREIDEIVFIGQRLIKHIKIKLERSKNEEVGTT